jgi:Protein of unknown function (DUF3168)
MLKDLRPALRTHLLNDPAIAALVDTRIFPLVLPQGIMATSIVYTLISGIGDHHMDGPSGLNRPRYQIDAWAASIDAASNLADKIKERIDGLADTIENVTIQGIFFANEREDYDDEAQLFRKSRDYLIWFEEH